MSLAAARYTLFYLENGMLRLPFDGELSPCERRILQQGGAKGPLDLSYSWVPVQGPKEPHPLELRGKPARARRAK